MQPRGPRLKPWFCASCCPTSRASHCTCHLVTQRLPGPQHAHPPPRAPSGAGHKHKRLQQHRTGHQDRSRTHASLEHGNWGPGHSLEFVIWLATQREKISPLRQSWKTTLPRLDSMPHVCHTCPGKFQRTTILPAHTETTAKKPNQY